MIHVGFTGTSKGMTLQQINKIDQFIKYATNPSQTYVNHNGDCMGADFEFGRKVFAFDWLIHLHPPKISTKRGFLEKYVTIYHSEKPKDYLVRNHDIVDSSQLLIATPKEMNEKIRSGTWATIRYARKKNKSILIILPDGSIQSENFIS